MSFCKSCGAVLGVGRFCTNCGAAVVSSPGERTSQAESPAEKTNPRLPAVQPDAATGARFPLFADQHSLPDPSERPEQARPGSEDATQVSAAVPPQPGPQASSGAGFHGSFNAPPAYSPGSHRSADDSDKARRSSKLIWVLPLVLAMIAVLSIGIWLGNRDDGSDDARGTDQSESPSPSESTSESTSPSPTAPTDTGAPPVDLTDQVTATGPEPIKPGVDLANKPVTYPVENVLDGKASTAYRVPGDASGKSITLALPGNTTVLEVGLINGYAKKDRQGGRVVDWYTRNRQVLEVQWIFDDGTTIAQKLSATKKMQVLAVNNIASTKVIMRIVKVSGKPTGELAKDVTAVSEVVVRGRSG